MSHSELSFWRWTGLAFTAVAVLAFISERKIAELVAHWTNAIVLIAVPVMVYLVAGIGQRMLKRLEAIELILRDTRGPRP